MQAAPNIALAAHLQKRLRRKLALLHKVVQDITQRGSGREVRLCSQVTASKHKHTVAPLRSGVAVMAAHLQPAAIVLHHDADHSAGGTCPKCSRHGLGYMT